MTRPLARLFVLLLCVPSWLQAAALTVQVQAATAQTPLRDAVVELFAEGPQLSAQTATPASMGQRNQAFTPLVLTVKRDTAVEFPNYDQTRHHVYSFSPAKVFDLKLYVGEPEAPVVFDKAGVVVLGCNIHDQMQGFVYVTDANRFVTTLEDGRASFEALPAGRYRVQVWHPWLTGGEAKRWVQTLELTADRTDLVAEIAVTPPPPRNKPLSDLQQRFRRNAQP